MFVQSIVGKDNTPIHRFLLVSEDESLTFIVGGVAKWRREEALASITQVEFSNLPFAALVEGSGQLAAAMTYGEDMLKKAWT